MPTPLRPALPHGILERVARACDGPAALRLRQTARVAVEIVAAVRFLPNGPGVPIGRAVDALLASVPADGLRLDVPEARLRFMLDAADVRGASGVAELAAFSGSAAVLALIGGREWLAPVVRRWSDAPDTAHRLALCAAQSGVGEALRVLGEPPWSLVSTAGKRGDDDDDGDYYDDDERRRIWFMKFEQQCARLPLGGPALLALLQPPWSDPPVPAADPAVRARCSGRRLQDHNECHLLRNYQPSDSAIAAMLTPPYGLWRAGALGFAVAHELRSRPDARHRPLLTYAERHGLPPHCAPVADMVAAGLVSEVARHYYLSSAPGGFFGMLEPLLARPWNMDPATVLADMETFRSAPATADADVLLAPPWSLAPEALRPCLRPMLSCAARRRSPWLLGLVGARYARCGLVPVPRHHVRRALLLACRGDHRDRFRKYPVRGGATVLALRRPPFNATKADALAVAALRVTISRGDVSVLQALLAPEDEGGYGLTGGTELPGHVYRDAVCAAAAYNHAGMLAELRARRIAGGCRCADATRALLGAFVCSGACATALELLDPFWNADASQVALESWKKLMRNPGRSTNGPDPARPALVDRLLELPSVSDAVKDFAVKMTLDGLAKDAFDVDEGSEGADPTEVEVEAEA